MGLLLSLGEGTMKVMTKPILCTRCKSLALAFFDGEPMCPHCLTASVSISRDPFAIGKIRPLASDGCSIKGLVKCRRNSKVHAPLESKATGSTSYTM
jgi:hypothetical protein